MLLWAVRLFWMATIPFLEVVEGMEVIDKIAATKTGPNDRPVEDVKMKLKVLENYKPAVSK